MIELLKELNESDLLQQVQLLQKENKDIKATLIAYSNEISLMNKQGSFFFVKDRLILMQSNKT